MFHVKDANDLSCILNFIEHPIVTDSQTPVPFAANQFSTRGWSRDLRQIFHRPHDPVEFTERQPLEISFDAPFNEDFIHEESLP